MNDSQLSPKSDCVLVLGMHRSGSSALARVLNLAGLRMPRQVLAANQDNPSGYWEPKRVVDCNNALLHQLDRHWADPKPLRPQVIQEQLGVVDLDAMATLLQGESAQSAGLGPAMVVKDPRLSRLAPFWRAALARQGVAPVCLITCRHPLDVWRSLHARDRIDRQQALELWLTYMLEAEAGTRGLVRQVVPYDDLMADWQGCLQRLGAAAPLIDAGAAQRHQKTIERFLNPGLRHHSARRDELSAQEPLHGWLSTVYDLYLQADGLQQTAAFDRVGQAWAAHWARSSPGDAGSGVAQHMPAWHAEQSAKHVAAGDDRAALDCLETAISLAPDIARFHHLRGNAWGRLGEHRQALVAHRRAVELGPKVPRFHRALADTLKALNLRRELVDVLGDLVSLAPSPAIHHEHGIWLARVGRLADAVTAQRAAIALGPKNRAPHVALCDALRHLGHRAEACEVLQAAITVGPVDADLQDKLGDLLASLNRWPQAKAAYDVAAATRCRMLGFRAQTPPGELAQAPPERARRHLLTLLARTGAAHWAKELGERIAKGSVGAVDSDLAWPLGSQVQHRPTVPVSGLSASAVAPRPLLSVMIPVYKVANEAWLAACLQSVLVQDEGPEWAEIVIVDDASDDPVAQRLCRSQGGRVRYVCHARNLGLVANHNACIDLARGEFVHILHQDDRVEPGFYRALLGPLQADSRRVAGFTHSRFINAQGDLLSSTDPPRPLRGVLADWSIRLSLETRIQFPAIMVRRSAYERVGGFFPGRRFSFDWDLWNRIAASGPMWYEPDPLALYRVHEDSATYQFSMKDRVIDAMQTVAAMVQLLPSDQHVATAEMAMYKFFRRYWGLVTQGSPRQDRSEADDLAQFLMTGWADAAEKAQLSTLLNQLR